MEDEGSILYSDKKSLNLLFPPWDKYLTCFSDQESTWSERIVDIWRQNPLWTPEHLRHNNIPLFIKAHLGFSELQSKHIVFPSRETISFKPGWA